MTGAELIDAFLATKRISAPRATVLGYLNLRYEELLGLESWTFLDAVDGLTLSAATVSGLPTDFGFDPKIVMSDNGCALSELPFKTYEQAFLGSTSTGRPEAFSIYGTTIYLGPTPDQSYAATLLYHRDPIDLADDSAEPILPSRTHLGLVAGAQAFALDLENDPTSQGLEARYQKTIDAMRRRYLSSSRGMVRQWGADPAHR